MAAVETPIACCAPLAAPVLDEQEAAATAELFKALADPACVRVVNVLATTGEPVCPLAASPARSRRASTSLGLRRRASRACRSSSPTRSPTARRERQSREDARARQEGPPSDTARGAGRLLLSETLADRSEWFRDDAEVGPASEMRHAAEDCIVHW
jgi:hypothetical protein